MIVTVAALYVEEGGVYYGLPDVDPWPASRDARLYAGPHPVVAHPPCQLWVNMAGVNFRRYGGTHNRPGNDGGGFASALASVLEFGGVLEHPAGSWAWPTFGLPRPAAFRPKNYAADAPSAGWNFEKSRFYSRFRVFAACEVCQSAYGHRARKRTWLFYCGDVEPPELDWSAPAGTCQVGWFDRIKPTLSKKAANATPPAFRDLLLSIARSSRGQEQAA